MDCVDDRHLFVARILATHLYRCIRHDVLSNIGSVKQCNSADEAVVGTGIRTPVTR
jgi:hypothetical protein